MFSKTIQKDKTIVLKMKSFVEHPSVFIDVKIVFKYIKYSHKKQKKSDVQSDKYTTYTVWNMIIEHNLTQQREYIYEALFQIYTQ